MLQLHDIEYQNSKHLDTVINESIPYLQELKNKGIIRYYGITSYPINIFKYIHESVKVDTMLCHCHYMLSDTAMLDMVPFAKNDGIGLIAASPLGMGLLTERGVADWHPATEADKATIKKAVQFCKDNGTTIEKLALQFGVSNPDIPTNLVSSSKVTRMVENVRIVEENMDVELVKRVQEILKPIHNKDFDFAGNCEFM